jgi:hypothetical protein
MGTLSTWIGGIMRRRDDGLSLERLRFAWVSIPVVTRAILVLMGVVVLLGFGIEVGMWVVLRITGR